MKILGFILQVPVIKYNYIRMDSIGGTNIHEVKQPKNTH